MAPATLPSVENRMTPGGVISVQVVKKPPKVRITSLGIGGKMFSTAISSSTPQ